MPRRIDVPNIPAEYEYTRSLLCQKCAGATSAMRKGSTSHAAEGYMIDHWEIQCSSCGYKDELEFSVPSLLGAALFAQFAAKAQPPARKPWWKFW